MICFVVVVVCFSFCDFAKAIDIIYVKPMCVCMCFWYSFEVDVVLPTQLICSPCYGFYLDIVLGSSVFFSGSLYIFLVFFAFTELRRWFFLSRSLLFSFVFSNL